MVRVVCLSDTHNSHWLLPPLPPGDVLVHAGDFTSRGTQKEIMDFNDWLGTQEHTYKVVVPGNHEIGFAESWSMARALLTNADFVLKDEGCEVMGKKLWGSPWTPEYGNWAFGYTKREGELRWAQIPEGLDMLITHGPPRLIMDSTYDREQKRHLNLGCPYLREQVLQRAKPRFHIFGHIHQPYGRGTYSDVVCCNVAQLDDRYQQEQGRVPVVLDL